MKLLSICRIGCNTRVADIVHDEIVQLVLSYATQHGYADLVEIILDKSGSIDLNGSLLEACIGGFKELVLLFIDRGANELEKALEKACENNQGEIADILIEKGTVNWEYNIVEEGANGNGQLLSSLIQQKGKYLNNGFIGACRGGHLEMVQKTVFAGADDLVHGLYIALENDHADIASFLLSRSTDDWIVSSRSCRYQFESK